jgi:hypothetical protein
MLVFIHGDGVRPPPEMHLMFITPAAHLQNTEVPAGWVDSHNRPRDFQLTFIHGRAEVDDEIGKYLLKQGLAQKSGAALFRASGF